MFLRAELVTAPFVAVGQVLAQQTGKLLGNKGNVVLIVPALGTSGSKSPMAIELQSFQRELKNTCGINVVATETITTPGMMMMMGSMLTVEDYRKLVAKYPRLDAFVSFVGAPQVNYGKSDQLPTTVPKLIAVCQMPIGLKTLFKTGLIQLAIVPRFSSEPATKEKPSTSTEWFDRYYQIIGVNDVESLRD